MPKKAKKQLSVTSDTVSLPLIPLRDVVVYPQMVIPLFIGRSDSIKALEAAMSADKRVLLIAQKNASVDSPTEKDLFQIGAVATILQMLRLPDGTVKVLVEGVSRAEVVSFEHQNEMLKAVISIHQELESADDPEIVVLMRNITAQFEQLIKVNKKIPPELLASIRGVKNAGNFADSIAAHLTISIESRQKILETYDIKKRIELLRGFISQELELLEVEKNVQGRVKQQVEKSQRQYYLSEKLKAIQQELGDLDEGAGDELKQFEKKIETAGMPNEAKEKAKSELNKLRMMPPMSAEATVSRNYLEALLSVPWKASSKTTIDLNKAQKVLDADHYGLKEVKERILEYLAVQQRVKKIKGPILCLVGPPGVGKTSLGQSIANATGRVFARIPLGGVRDEAEIRGHRRTYIGAMMGKILQRMVRAKVRNPLFMLDEVDKMAMDFRGDPASALLEVLDPEQNNKFNDHYLEVDYDLSDVMFIATANSLNIPPALLDRMEIIRLPGYTEEEKLHIAQNYLIPRQIDQTGLKKEEIKIEETAIREIIRIYTREAGVRSLERELSKICRKVVRHAVTHRSKKGKHTDCVTVTVKNLEQYLGVPKHRYGLAEDHDQVGQVTGLAWTEVGGELLTIEAQCIPGKGKLLHTGSLGDVMKESINAAMTVVRSRAHKFGIKDKYFQDHDFHVHVPEGATPKDGPSAGIGMCTALVSAITHISVHATVAMTGEITLRGEVLPIGGLKEKLLAALRGNIKTVIIPEENKRDLKEIPKEVLDDVEIHPVRWIDQVFEIALERVPKAKRKSMKAKKH
ncbi:MAG: endopeptidase La [Gammaproteobacteria bacterium RIFCSPHIGHO2_12_FULL_42_13]|nr:MAG: endopeptidase La [Gammaproteobacteria bacterium RIFCSPHIGHO2_12_FULL_42_13]